MAGGRRAFLPILDPALARPPTGHDGRLPVRGRAWMPLSCSETPSLFVHVDTRPHRRSRWATLTLIVVCVAIYMRLALMPTPARVDWLLDWGTVPADLFSGGGAWNPRLLGLDAARLVTALFIHVTWLHLISNLLFLAVFGLPAERTLGAWRFLLLFLLGGALANLIGALSLAEVRLPIIGCSGAVSAVVGTYVALFPRARPGLVLPLGLYLQFVRVPAFLLIGFWVVLQLLFSYAGPSYGAYVWWAHIGGFLFGVGYALVAREGIARRMRH